MTIANMLKALLKFNDKAVIFIDWEEEDGLHYIANPVYNIPFGWVELYGNSIVENVAVENDGKVHILINRG